MERKHIGEQNTEMCNGAGIAKEGFLDRKFRERNLIGKEGKRGPSPASKYSETAGNHLCLDHPNHPGVRKKSGAWEHSSNS